MVNNKKNISYHSETLAKEVILDFLTKNNTSHYVDLSDLVDLNDYSTKLSINATHFNLYEKDKLIGFSGCYFNDVNSRMGYISGISILDGYRRIGLGSDLLQHIIEYGRDLGFKEININPDCKNIILIKFLEKNGFIKFEKIGERCLLKYYIN